MPDDDLAFTPASELRRLIDYKQVSVAELTELYLRRIESLNPKLNAYLTVTGDEAMASARSADQDLSRGAAKGPFHGIPISIKDLELTKGIRSTMGSLVFKDHVPDMDAAMVERVRASGAIILGKTNTPEFGTSGTTENRLGDACRNPWNTERTTGGSSGGAGAAVAAGLCALATGSDGGGSIRIPSSFCGIYGIKPTQGRVPRYGGVGRPVHSTLGQSGPMTRTVADSAALLQVLAGPDSRDVGCMRQQPPDFLAGLDRGVKGLKVAWSPDLGYAAVDREVVEVAGKGARVFEELGCTVEEGSVGLENPFPIFYDTFSVQLGASFGHLLEEHRGEMTGYALETIDRGLSLSGPDLSRTMQSVAELQAHMETFFETYDLLLTPTMAVPAFPVGKHPAVIGGRDVIPFWGYTPFTFPFNMTMQTAASVPCGYSSDGMPIGLHIIGRRGEETTVLRASAAFEAARPWAGKRPPVS